MKVLHIETGRHLYGGAYQVLQLLRLLKGRGEHILVCPEDSEIDQEATGCGIETAPIRIGGDASVGAYFSIRRVIRAHNPDIVHIHSRRGAHVWGVLAAIRAHRRLVITRRVDNPESRFEARLRYAKACRVVGISEKICEVLASEGVPEGKILCIRSGVDTHVYAPRKGHTHLGENFGIGADEQVVAMVAQFIPRKGHNTLVEAIPAILEQHPRTRFLILGRGWMIDDIRDKCAQFGDRVVIPGFRNDISDILPECGLLVHPAEKEGLGVAILQAAACGLPVVASRAGGIPEVVIDGRSGFLIPPEDAAALAQNVNALLGEPELRKAMGNFARDFAEKELSVEAMADANFAMYEEIMKA